MLDQEPMPMLPCDCGQDDCTGERKACFYHPDRPATFVGFGMATTTREGRRLAMGEIPMCQECEHSLGRDEVDDAGGPGA